MRLRFSSLAFVTLAVAGCASSSVPAAASASADPSADWITRGAAAVRVSDKLEDTRNCDFVGALHVLGGWDGVLEGMTPTEDAALNEMKRAAVQAGGNFILLYPGAEPSAEAYLCTE
jgi:hypothetical protein